jgi:endo-1,4-beta-xylanase
MKHLLCLFVLILLTSCVPASMISPTPTMHTLATDYTPSNPSLRSLAYNHSLTIGAAVAPGPLRDEQAYAQALSHEFSILTPENAMKFGPIHPQPDQYHFTGADTIVEFAMAHDPSVDA